MLVEKGDEVALTKLHQSGKLDLSVRDGRGWQPLHHAVSNDNRAMVDLLIELGADVNGRTGAGTTPLHFAASYRNEQIIRSLVQKGALLDATDALGKSLNDWAGDDFTKELLIRLGAERSIDRSDDWTKMTLGDTVNDFYVLVNASLSRDAATIATDLTGEKVENAILHESMTTPVMITPRNCNLMLWEAVLDGHLERAEALLGQGADISYQNPAGNQLIHAIASLGIIDTLSWLIGHGADINVLNGDGDRPIRVAALRGRKELVKWLLDHGARLNVRDSVAGVGNTDPTSLIAHDADCSTQDSSEHQVSIGDMQSMSSSIDEQAAHEKASSEQEQYEHIMQAFVKHGAQDSPEVLRGAFPDLWQVPLLRALLLKEVETATLIIALYADPSEEEKHIINQGLVLAAAQQQYSILELIFRNFHEILSAQSLSYALLCVVMHRQLDMVDYIVERVFHHRLPLPINQAGHYAWKKSKDSSLSESERAEFKHMVKVLSQMVLSLRAQRVLSAPFGVQIGSLPKLPLEVAAHIADYFRSSFGYHATMEEEPIHVAAQRGDLATVKSLVNHGVDINLKSKNRAQPIHYAALGGHQALVEWLVAHGADIKAINNGWMRQPIHCAAKEGHQALVEWLVDRGADIQATDEERRQPIHWAAKGGHQALVEWLVAQGADINAKTIHGRWQPIYEAAAGGHQTLLEWLFAQGAGSGAQHNAIISLAAENGHLNMVRWLVEAGFSINHDYGPLDRAAACGHLHIVRWLLEHGADATDRNLVTAAEKGDLRIVQCLVEHGASINAGDNSLPIHGAAWHGHLNVVQWLAEHGADINACDDSNGRMPIHYAIDRLDIVQCLIRHGAVLSGRDNEGCQPLHLVFRRELPWDRGLLAFGSELIEVMEYLVKQGADIDAPDNHGWRLIHHAASRGSRAMVQWLVEQGVAINSQTDGGNEPIHLAAESGDLGVVQYLVKHGAGVNSRAGAGFIFEPLHLHTRFDGQRYQMLTPAATICCRIFKNDELISPAGNDYPEVVRWLVNHGATCSHEGDSAYLHFSTLPLDLNVMRWLAGRRASIRVPDFSDGAQPIHFAAKCGHLEIVKWFISQGAKVDCTDNAGKTLLHYAARSRNLPVVQWLVEHGASINWMVPARAVIRGNLDIVQYLVKHIDSVTQRDCSPRKGQLGSIVLNKNMLGLLTLATSNGHLSIVEWLVEQGVPLNGQDNSGDYPIHAAAKHGYLDIMRCLVKHGAAVDVRNKSGDSPMHLAAENERSMHIVRWLVEQGAPLDVRNNSGDYLIHLAARNGHLSMVEYLVEHGASVDVRNKGGFLPVHLAAENGHMAIVEWLTKRGVTSVLGNKKHASSLSFK